MCGPLEHARSDCNSHHYLDHPLELVAGNVSSGTTGELKMYLRSFRCRWHCTARHELTGFGLFAAVSQSVDAPVIWSPFCVCSPPVTHLLRSGQGPGQNNDSMRYARSGL